MAKIHNDDYLIMDLDYEDVFRFKKVSHNKEKITKFYKLNKSDDSNSFEILNAKEIMEAKERRFVLKIFLPTICFVFLLNFVLSCLFAVFFNAEVDFFDKINTLVSTWFGFILGRYFKPKA